MKTKKLLLILFVVILLALIGFQAVLGGNQSLSGFMMPVKVWGFESNQAAQTSPYDHRLLLVGSAGDVNGDGYEDILVAKRDYDQPSYTDNGQVWLYYGSASGLNPTPNVIFTPPYANTYGFFGAQAISAGDVNGDGFDDILIGMDNYDNAASDEGAVFVYNGSASGVDTTYDWMARGNNTYAHFGFTADSAGDVNGDGYDDIIVGASRTDDNNISHAYVWYGSASGLGSNGTPANADWYASDTYPGQASGDGFARVVRGVGDVNGDGYDDVLVSAHLYDGGLADQGAVFVYYGSASGLGPTGTTGNADWNAVSGQSSSRFGLAADGIGDVNGDGYDDIAIGAYYYGNPEANEGKVFVWYGGTDGLGPNGNASNTDWTAEGNAYGLMGFAVRPAGDVNGDQFVDLIVTMPYAYVNSGGVQIDRPGKWFVWFGGISGFGDAGTPENADIVGLGDQPLGGLGRDDAAGADVNNDGFDEIFVAAWAYDHPESDEGMVFGYISRGLSFMPIIFGK